MTKFLIKNGHVIDPANNVDEALDVLIEDGKIVKLEKNLQADDAEVLDASGKIVSPGFIDIHVHLREPGREDKETIYAGTRSAAKGGITTVVAMPNTTPVADNQTIIQYVLSKAKTDAAVNVFASGTITKGLNGKEIAEIWDMQKSGAVCVTDDGYDVQNLDVYRKAMQYCKTYNMPMISHTEDHDLAKDGQMHEGKVSSRLGLKGLPACAEDAATARIICLVEDTGHKMHFTHVSTKGSLDLIKLAQSKGLDVTADVTPHHFTLTDEAVETQWTYAKVHPPLRSEDHRKAVIEALKDGTASVIGTDHAPHLWTEKERQFDQAPPGMVGFETMLPLIITELVDKKHLTMSQAIEKITINPAKVIGLDKGTLSPGADADIAVFDPKESYTVDRTKFVSKGQNSPFHGVTLNGMVTETFVSGKLVVKNSKVIV
jgi:dihydroorotase